MYFIFLMSNVLHLKINDISIQNLPYQKYWNISNRSKWDVGAPTTLNFIDFMYFLEFWQNRIYVGDPPVLHY